MARIAGVDLPRDKHAWVSLQYIYGIGPTLSRKILAKTNISPDTKVSDLTEEEVNRLREAIDKQYKVEGELRREIQMNIKRLICRFEDNGPGPMLAPDVVSARLLPAEDRGAAWPRNN
jgi:small subunit ribosomal protein S13